MALLALFSFKDLLATLSARPYAAGLLCALLSSLSLANWLKSPSRKELVLYVLALILMLYCHYLYGALLVVHLLAALLHTKKISRQNLALLSLAWIVTALAMLPFYQQIKALFLRQEELVYLSTPLLSDLWAALLPPGLIGALVLSAVATRLIFYKQNFKLAALPASALWQLAFFSYLLLPLLFFAQARLSGGSLFLARYFLPYSVRFCVCLAAFCFSISPLVARSLLALLAALLLFYSRLGESWVHENWREATAMAQKIHAPGNPIFTYTGLIELENPAWLSDKSKQAYLNAPLSHYAPELQSVPLPSHLETPQFQAYFKQNIEPLLSSNSKILFLSLRSAIRKKELSSAYVSDYYVELFKRYGFKAEIAKMRGQVLLVRFLK